MEIAFPRHTITTLPDTSVNLSDKMCQNIYPLSPLYATLLSHQVFAHFHGKDVTNGLEKTSKSNLNDIGSLYECVAPYVGKSYRICKNKSM